MDNKNLMIGKILDQKYRIERIVGSGGMATVYSAINIDSGRRVAIKLMRSDVNDYERSVRRFMREARAISVLNHPNIVKINDISMDGEDKYIVMEYIEGMTLRAYMDVRGVIDWRDAVQYADQILLALDHAHKRDIVHRDIKPQNIMLMNGGYVKVMDFGIAKVRQAETITTMSHAIGTSYYMSPEQAKNVSDIDCRSDIYSLGIMLYEMVTGRLPFIGESQIEVALKQQTEKPIPPTEVNAKIPAGLEQIILCAMEKKRENRFQSAAQMLRQLRRFSMDPTIVFVQRHMSMPTPTSDDVIKGTRKNSNPDTADIPNTNVPEQTAKPQPAVKPQPAARPQPVQQVHRPAQGGTRVAGQHTQYNGGIPKPPSQPAVANRKPTPQARPVQPAVRKKKQNEILPMSLILVVFMLFVILAAVCIILFVKASAAQTSSCISVARPVFDLLTRIK